MAGIFGEQLSDSLADDDTIQEAVSNDTLMLDLTMSDADEPGTTDDENMSSEPESERAPSPIELIDENDIYTDVDIFDEGSSDGESSLDSMSTCFEELDDEGPMIRVVEYRVTEEESELINTGYLKDSDIESEVSNWSAEDIDESLSMEGSQTLGTPGTEAPDNHAPVGLPAKPTVNHGPKRPKTFSELESQKYKLLLKGDRNLKNEKYHWELKAAQEEMASLERLMESLKEKIEVLEQEKQEAEHKVNSDFEDAGISPELYAEYEAFCFSLNPEFGQRNGFLVTCYSSHGGEYVTYDPDLSIFKDAVEDEMPHNDRSFRAEASGTNIIEFWPLKCPEPLTDEVHTWGDQYPDLYGLAIEAVREHKSEAAMEMLVRLPDMNATLGGGWLFEYVQEPMLSCHPILSMRWRYQSAHKIDSPVSVEGKRLRIQLMLQPDAVEEQASLEEANMLLGNASI